MDMRRKEDLSEEFVGSGLLGVALEKLHDR